MSTLSALLTGEIEYNRSLVGVALTSRYFAGPLGRAGCKVFLTNSKEVLPLYQYVDEHGRLTTVYPWYHSYVHKVRTSVEEVQW